MAELIQREDSLNTGREKLNEAIKASDRAEQKSDQAVSTSNEARSQSQIAENKADNVQEQFNQVVIEGDSSVEAAQARADREGKTYGTLKERLDSSDERLVNITYDVTQFGINMESEDNTGAFNNIVESIPEGSRVLFPKGIYRGNFISNKSLDLDFQESTLIPVTDNIPVFRFEGSEESPKNVIGNPEYGDITFEVEDVDGLEIDDIGYLVDDSLRPTDNRANQNTELVKIKNISSNTITVYDKIRSNQNTGNVRFVKINPLKKPSYKNVYFEIPDSHNSTISGFLRCERTYVDNVEVRNSSGLAVEHTLCFGFTINNIDIIKPYQSTSGKGYGVGVYKSRLGSIRDVYGIYSRHLVDLDSSYQVTIEDIEDEYALSSSVVLSHNGYAGKITARNINIVLDNLANYGVQMSDQGLADVDKQCFRDIIIEDVEITVPNHISGTLLNAVRILNHFADISIDNIKINIQSDTVNIPVNTTGVYIRGNPQGNLVITNIIAEKIETDVTVERKNSNHQD